MNAVSVIVATAAFLLQSVFAVPSGAHYRAGYNYGGYGAGYGYGSYGAGYGYGGHEAGYGYGASHGAYNDLRYHGPQAIPVVLPDGHIADTHEVAAAKGAHYTAVAKAKALSHAVGYNEDHYGSYAGGYGVYDAGSHGAGYGSIYSGYNGGYGSYGAGKYGGYASGSYGAGYGYGLNTPYHGPIAKPVVLPSGYLADTYDVAANKAAHLNALSHAAHSHADWAPRGSHGYH